MCANMSTYWLVGRLAGWLSSLGHSKCHRQHLWLIEQLVKYWFSEKNEKIYIRSYSYGQQ